MHRNIDVERDQMSSRKDLHKNIDIERRQQPLRKAALSLSELWSKYEIAYDQRPLNKTNKKN